MKKLRLSAEYGAPPIFNPTPDEMGHIDIDDLNLSSDLLIKIREWDFKFQKTFADDYPPDSGFKILDDLQQHNKVGAEIAELIQQEMGGNIFIEFVPLK